MNRTVLDTDILSEILKRRDANVAAKASAYLAEISVLEVVRGYRRVGREAKLESFERAL